MRRTPSRAERGPVLLRAVVVVLALASCSTPRPEQPNVLVIVVDALRADHLGCYGHDRPTSPRLDALASEGVRFADARAASSWTLPSVASILSGVYPAVHGADRHESVLSRHLRTMPEAFADAGYRTAAVSANPTFVTAAHGLARGFDEFSVLRGPDAEEPPAAPGEAASASGASADDVTRAALAWITDGGDASPFFLYVHYGDPAAPYVPPRALAERFGAADTALAGAAQWPLLAPDAPVGAAEIAMLEALYDGEIAAVDAAVGVLIDDVRARAGRPLLLAIAGDHGEEFGEHGGLQHGRGLWDEVLHVPLLLVGPGVPRGVVVHQPVSLVSLWPTLAALAGVAPPPRPGGPALTAAFDPDAAPSPVQVFADLEPRFQNDAPAHRRAVIDGEWKLTLDPDRQMRLYDLGKDAREEHDVAAAERERRRRLSRLLRVRDTRARTARVAAPPTRQTDEHPRLLGSLP
jgi:arylsulfatase